jgi:XRE family transcriptional regulator, fatty acid utilization regulator
MAGSKIFAGSKLRRIRNRLQFSQAAMAESLAISASYLNLIERDQRPITAQLLIKLNSLHDVDIAELATTPETNDTVAKLKEVISDALLIGEIPSTTELQEATQAAPNLVGATIKLYQAYREVLKRLGELSQNMALGAAPQSSNSFNAVRSFVQQQISFPTLEALAEEIWFELSPKDDPMAGLKAKLRSHSGIDVRFISTDILGHDRARYDRHSQRLLISEKLNSQERLWEVALLAAQLDGRSTIDDIIAKHPLSTQAESKRLLKQELAQYLALAILCPMAKFMTSAEDLKLDIEALAMRFGVSRMATMKRLATTSNFGFLLIDASGSVIEKIGSLGFHLPQSGSLCGHLPIFACDQKLKTTTLQSSDSKQITMIALHEGHFRAGLILSPGDLSKTIYRAETTRPLGPTCRLCEIKNCALRREPPATRPAALNEFVRGASDFEPM